MSETIFDKKYLGTGLETQNERERVELVSHYIFEIHKYRILKK